MESETTATKSAPDVRREIRALRRFCADLESMDHAGRRAALLYLVSRYFSNYVADIVRTWASH